MENDNDKLIKITKGKIKLAGLLLGLTLTAAGGYAISKSGSSEKEQISVETEAELEEEIKTEKNSFFSKEPVVKELSGDNIYEGDELNTLYLAFSKEEEKMGFILVREVSISDICTKDTKNNKDITYGEYYLGDDCYNIFEDGSTKETNNIKLYVSVPDNILVTAINYRGPEKDGRYISKTAVIEKAIELQTPEDQIASGEERHKNIDIIGFQIYTMEKATTFYSNFTETEELTKIGTEEISLIEDYFGNELYEKRDPNEFNLSEPDGYIKYTKKR